MFAMPVPFCSGAVFWALPKHGGASGLSTAKFLAFEKWKTRSFPHAAPVSSVAARFDGSDVGHAVHRGGCLCPDR